MKGITVKELLWILLGTGVHFLLGRFVSIPVPGLFTGISLQWGFLAVLSLVCGPYVGWLAGALGQFLLELATGVPWWTCVAVAGAYGCGVGLWTQGVDKEDPGLKDHLKFQLGQVWTNLLCWGYFAPVLEMRAGVVMETAYAMGIRSALVNILTTGLFGGLLFFAWSARERLLALLPDRE